MSKSKEVTVVTPEEKGLFVNSGGGGIAGLEDMRREQLRIPKLRLVQPTSRERPEGANEGDFVLPTQQTVLGTTAYMMPISLFHTRAMWPKRDEVPVEEQDKPLCTSANSKAPDSGAGPADPQGVQASICAECYFAQWRTNDRGKRVPPRCAFTINFFALLLDENQRGLGMATVSFAKSGYPCGEQIINSLAGTPGIRGIWERWFELKSELRVDENRYFIPKFRPMGETNATNKKEGSALFGLWKEEYEKMVTRSSFEDEAIVEAH